MTDVGEDAGGTTGHLNWYQKRSAQKPVLIAAFAGWNDAGNAASSAAEYLEGVWSAAPFATIDAEEFFDLLSNNIDIVKALFRHLLHERPAGSAA